MGSMSHWPIEKGENDVKDTLSVLHEVVFLVFGSHDLFDGEKRFGSFCETTRFFGVHVLYFLSRKGINGQLEPYW